MRKTLTFLCVLGVGLASPAWAVDTYWNVPGPASWYTSGNWDTGNLPTSADVVYIENGGTVQVDQAGQTAYTDGLRLGTSTGSGTIELSAGVLNGDGSQFAHSGGTAIFVQTGGTFNTGWCLYSYSGGVGAYMRYELQDGYLNSGLTRLGGSGMTVEVVQSGGTFRMCDDCKLQLMYNSNPDVTYTMSAGKLTAPMIYLNTYGYGSVTWNITSTDVDITVADTDDPDQLVGELVIGGRSGMSSNNVTITAPEGGTGETVLIHMVYANLLNNMPAAYETQVAGLNNITLLFEGKTVDANTFEVAGDDQGAVSGGLTNNFALEGLTLGGAGAGYVQLVDVNDNQSDGVENEALYVENLTINAAQGAGTGSCIDLNGLNLYFKVGVEMKKLYQGDANVDGVVNDSDLSLLLASWLKTDAADGVGWAEGDFTCDGTADDADLSLLLANWTPGGAVPEPATLCLLGLGGLGLLARRRR